MRGDQRDVRGAIVASLTQNAQSIAFLERQQFHRTGAGEHPVVCGFGNGPELRSVNFTEYRDVLRSGHAFVRLDFGGRMNAIPHFLGGAIVFGYGLIALYFLKFWRRTRDPFFGCFAFAFLLLGFGRIAEAVVHTSQADTPVVYLFRLAAFLIIIFAIMHKNLAVKK
jgi:hypothetical protein